jgi:nickel-dependent lactate racemase
LVAQALDEPVGDFDWARWRGIRSAAIAVNDKTRPVPHEHLLPPLLQRLAQLGLRPQDIQFLIATGTHSVMPPVEYPLILPQEIIQRYPIACHDATDEAGLAYVGQTRRGTPVWMNRRFLEAQLRIAVGNAEPHQIMGYSGGVKSAVIGLAGKATIQRNHALMAEPGVEPGRYHDNPARQDLEEMGHLVGVHLALNGVLNADKQIVHAVAGDPIAVMEAAIPLVRSVYQLDVDEAFDLLIVSPGGHPKDINVYQAQKALGHATPVSRAAGAIILAAACPEGSGSRAYEDWVAGMGSHEAVIERFRREGFAIGPHKAFQIARDTIGRRVLWVKDMPPVLTQRLLLDRADSLSQALALVLPGLPVGARIGIMPVANANVESIKTDNRAAGPGPHGSLTA